MAIVHIGEMLSFMLERCYDMSTCKSGWGPCRRPLRQVWGENIWVTAFGTWSLAPSNCLLEDTKIDRIKYSVETPFESNERGREWLERLERLEASSLQTQEQLEMVAFRHAERLLKVQAPSESAPRILSGSQELKEGGQ